MRGAEALSTYAPIDEAEKFRIEYWALEEAKLRRLPPPQPLAGRVALVTGGGVGHRPGHRRPPGGRGRGGRASPTATSRGPRPWPADLGGADVAVGGRGRRQRRGRRRRVRSRRPPPRYGGVDLVVNNAGLSISKPLVETTADDWDLQHRVMARGSFLVSREAARVMEAQGLPADIVYVVSKNAVVAGPDNVAYGAAKADQAHQVRLLATELGPLGVRVNGVNPDGVVRGSGIFEGGWGDGAGQGVRRVPRGARQVLRRAHRARPRGAARARRRRGVRPLLGRPGAHDRHDRARWTAGCRWRSYGEGEEPTMTIDRSRIDEENEIRLAWHESDLAHALDVVGRAGVDGEAVVAEVARFSVAAPSWAVGTGGTRFGRFPGGGEPRDTIEKIDDVAALNALTGANRTVSLHVPWDDPGPGRRRRAAAPRRGAGHRLRRHELQHVPGQPVDHPRRRGVLQVRQPGQRRRGRPQGGDRAQPLRDRPRRRAGVAGAHRVAGRRHEPPGPGQLPGPVRAGARRACARSTPTCPTTGRCTPSTSPTSRRSTRR